MARRIRGQNQIRAAVLAFGVKDCAVGIDLQQVQLARFVGADVAEPAPSAEPDDLAGEVARLQRELAELRQEVAALREHLGS